jgi:multidrug efflux system membrane fusion protein
MERIVNHHTEAAAVGILTAVVVWVSGVGAGGPSMAQIPSAVAAEAGNALRPQVSGRITSINFLPGQKVTAGDVLLTIDPGPFQAAFDAAQARLAKAQWRYEFAVRNRGRTVNRLASHKASREELESSMAAVERATVTVQADRAALKEAQVSLSNTNVIAPQSGVVGRPEVAVGSFAESGKTQITTLIPAGRIELAAY